MSPEQSSSLESHSHPENLNIGVLEKLRSRWYRYFLYATLGFSSAPSVVAQNTSSEIVQQNIAPEIQSFLEYATKTTAQDNTVTLKKIVDLLQYVNIHKDAEGYMLSQEKSSGTVSMVVNIPDIYTPELLLHVLQQTFVIDKTLALSTDTPTENKPVENKPLENNTPSSEKAESLSKKVSTQEFCLQLEANDDQYRSQVYSLIEKNHIVIEKQDTGYNLIASDLGIVIPVEPQSNAFKLYNDLSHVVGDTGEEVVDTENNVSHNSDLLHEKELGLIIKKEGNNIIGTHNIKKVNSKGKVLWQTEGLRAHLGTLDHDNFELFNAPNENSTYLRVVSDSGSVLIAEKTGKIIFGTGNINPRQKSELKGYNIHALNAFYSRQMVSEVIKNRKALQDGNIEQLTQKPVVVIFAPAHDYNNVFRANNYDRFINQYTVLYFEIRDEDSLYAAIRQLQPLRKKVEYVIMGGHSSKTHTSFVTDGIGKSSGDEKESLDMEDFAELSEAGSFPHATFIHQGCEAGQGENSIAETIARALHTEKMIALKQEGNVLYVFDADKKLAYPQFTINQEYHKGDGSDPMVEVKKLRY